MLPFLRTDALQVKRVQVRLEIDLPILADLFSPVHFAGRPGFSDQICQSVDPDFHLSGRYFLMIHSHTHTHPNDCRADPACVRKLQARVNFLGI